MAVISQKQLSKISVHARVTIEQIIKKLSGGGTLLPGDIGLLGFSFRCAREKDVAEIFHVSTRLVRIWVVAGCPKTPDGHYDIYQVHKWLMERQEKNLRGDDDVSLKDQKTQKEIQKLEKQSEKLEIELDALKKATVPSELHMQVRVAQAEAFSQFMLNTLQLNMRKLRSVSDDEASEIIESLAKSAMQHIIKTGDQISV